MRKITTFAAVAVVALLALAVAGPAAAKDRNDDNIPDRWEKKHGLSLKKNQARKDQDRDGSRNKAEFHAKTDPRDEDTDDDGVEDGDENAGTIESFDPATGTLVINLFGGDVVEGTVDEDTEIECGCRGDSEDSDDGEDDSVRRDSGPGHGGDGDDNSGPGHGGGDCTLDDLVAGTAVHEAELKATADGLVYTEIELVGEDPSDDEDEDEDDDDGEDEDDDGEDDDGEDDQGSGDN